MNVHREVDSASEMGRLYKSLTTMRADGHKCSACLFNVRLKYFVFMKLSLADRIHRDINILNLFSTSGREGAIQMRGHLFKVGKSKEAYHNLLSRFYSKSLASLTLGSVAEKLTHV